MYKPSNFNTKKWISQLYWRLLDLYRWYYM